METHLGFYRRYGISPVRYNASLSEHMEIRGALYRRLGILPLSIRHAKVLEVAAGSGQNSLHVAAQLPITLTLVEPNPVAMREIRSLYAGLQFPHTRPSLLGCRLQEFETAERFDIVICENWLGSSAHDRRLLRKLATFVAEDGLLIVTTMSPVGLIPNVIRRVLGDRASDVHLPFEDRRAQLVAAFEPHLATLVGMTRAPVDWVQDNMINPAYYGIDLTLPLLLSELGAGFGVLRSSPSFAQDWRWFKAMRGEEAAGNEHLLREYWKYSHDFIDHRASLGVREPASNIALEGVAETLIDAASSFEESLLKHRPAETSYLRVIACTEEIAKQFVNVASVAGAIADAKALLERSRISIEDVRSADRFAAWFGRETMYVSLMREAGSVPV